MKKLRFGNDWPEAKWHVFENIIVYVGLIGFDLCFDFLVRICGLLRIGGRYEGHPFSFGLFQSLFLAFCAVQLWRMLEHWKVYGKMPWAYWGNYRFESEC